MKSTKTFFLVALVISSSLTGCRSQSVSPNNSLSLIATIPLPDVNGRIDHFDVDTRLQIVFVAALGSNTVEVVDLRNKKVIHSIKDLAEPQGVAFIAAANSIFVSNGDNGECDIFDAVSYQRTKSIKLSGDADNVRYDSSTHKIYVGYGDGGIAVIDANTFKLLTEIKLDDHPESQLDKASKRIYVNVPARQQIEVIDLEKGIVVDKWKLTEEKSNFPMCLDEENHRLFIGCRHPAKLQVLDTRSGKTIALLDIDSDVDDIFFDQASHRIYLSCGGGNVDIFKQIDENTYLADGKITTNSGARTSMLIPELEQFVVASPSGFNREAELSVYKIKK